MYKPRAPIALDEKSYDLSLDCLINKKTITLSRKEYTEREESLKIVKRKKVLI